MAINISEVEKHISAARLNSYRGLNPTGTTEETIGLYYWNKALSAAFFPAIQCLEVTLRNAIHTAASAHFKNGAWYDQLVKKIGDDLFNNGKLGFNATLNRRERTESEKKIQEAKSKLMTAGKTVTPSGVIAELSFGFWVTLLNSQYEDIATKSRLWPNLTTVVFPNAGGARRKHLFLKYKNIKDIRNRLSHHEPLWKSSSSTSLSSAAAYVATQYNEVMTCIGYISTDRREYLLDSYMGREFNRLISLDSISEFMGRMPTGAVPVHRFKKDLNLHLNNCARGAVGYVTRGNGEMFKITKV